MSFLVAHDGCLCNDAFVVVVSLFDRIWATTGITVRSSTFLQVFLHLWFVHEARRRLIGKPVTLEPETDGEMALMGVEQNIYRNIYVWHAGWVPSVLAVHCCSVSLSDEMVAGATFMKCE